MAISKRIHQIRSDASMSQEQFAEILGVSRQSVQKWESGAAIPELEKLIQISKWFDVTLDALVLDSDARIVEELKSSKVLKPNYTALHPWESYASDLATEYQQSVEEGLDIAAYADVFESVAHLPQSETKERLSDVLFDVVINAKQVENYPYLEPSELDEIKRCAKGIPRAMTSIKAGCRGKSTAHGWDGFANACWARPSKEFVRTSWFRSFRKPGIIPCIAIFCAAI